MSLGPGFLFVLDKFTSLANQQRSLQQGGVDESDSRLLPATIR